MQGAKKPESGVYTIVTQIEALGNLMEALIPSFSGDWKRRKITKLTNMSLSEKLTICEDGLSEGTEARPFDDEGTPSEKRYLVKNGEIKSFLYDRETAALEGVDESGACGRSFYNDPPSIGSSNITISPGKWKDLGELDNYIELHFAHGSHTANLTTGDIGLEASSAFLVKGEERTPLKGFMVTGNIFEMFSNIEAIESKTNTMGWFVAPRIAFKNVHVVS
jgi:PmbA protein